jgi:hypothetical protein
MKILQISQLAGLNIEIEGALCMPVRIPAATLGVAISFQ